MKTWCAALPACLTSLFWRSLLPTTKRPASRCRNASPWRWRSQAASRGAAEVLLVEQDAGQVRSLSALVTRLKAQNVLIERGDGVTTLRQRRGQAWDLVFLDPPFGTDDNAALLQAALEVARGAVHAGGEIYLEAPQPWTDAMLEPLGLVSHRQGKAGAVAFQLLRLSTPV